MDLDERDILYLTYDGITEPLGESQILAYLLGLSKKYNWKFDILSFEKKHVPEKKKAEVKNLLNTHDIGWTYKGFTDRPPLISTLFDMYRMYFTAKNLISHRKYKIIHARSLLPAYVGLKLKRRHKNIKLIFDMRGFWQDQRIESRVWNSQNQIYKLLYKRTKAIEKDLLIHSDHIVVLTEAAKKVIEQWKKAKHIPT
ncbi:MAG: glycosyltransferase family 4 protein, partial [Chlorobi bacterium]|nr:glycosyltransferase family 4 protein [Chlorobiota bacterium]